MGALEDVAEGNDFTGGRGTVLMRAASTVWCVSSAVRSARVRSRRCLRPCGDVIRDVVGDGELLLASWQKWDEACAERLLGNFAFAFWDWRSQTLFCAQDVMGCGRSTTITHQARGSSWHRKAAVLTQPVPRDLNEGRRSSPSSKASTGRARSFCRLRGCLLQICDLSVTVTPHP